MPSKYDYETHDNADILIDVTVTDQDDAAVDLTAATLIYYVAGVAKAQTGSGITVTDAAAGEASIVVDKAAHGLSPGVYAHRLWIGLASDQELVYFQGTLTIGDGDGGA